MRKLRARPARVVGVWEGTYTSVTPTGELIERYRSRPETGFGGDL